MSGVSAWFFGSAIVYGILGMVLGNIMGMTQDHGQLPTHAHLLVIGWVSFAIFGLFYHQFPARAGSLLARLHFWLGQASYIVLIVGLYLIFSGNPEAGEPFAGIGSIAYLLSMVLFAVVALPVVTGRR
jgi:heme/copper-type cytochrome/quinol oxidase subunit 1